MLLFVIKSQVLRNKCRVFENKRHPALGIAYSAWEYIPSYKQEWNELAVLLSDVTPEYKRNGIGG